MRQVDGQTLVGRLSFEINGEEKYSKVIYYQCEECLQVITFIESSSEIILAWLMQNLIICLECGCFAVPKVIEHDLCKGLSVTPQHVTNHEIIYSDSLSLKAEVIVLRAIFENLFTQIEPKLNIKE